MNKTEIAILAKEMIDIANRRNDLFMTIDINPYTGYSSFTIDDNKRKIFEYSPECYEEIKFSPIKDVTYICCNDKKFEKTSTISKKDGVFVIQNNRCLKALKKFVDSYKE